MRNRQKWITFLAVIGVFAFDIQSEPSPDFKVFLCFGQSNMSGGAGCNPDQKSKETHPRIKVLPFDNCNNPQRTKDVWADASEPMHCGDNMNMMGPSYAFAQTLIDSLPATDTIGLIPCGIWGSSIEIFMKGKTNTSSSYFSGWGNNVRDKMIAKCKEAVKRGVFTGIILHQGESNSGQSDWPEKVKNIYDDIKAELNLPNDVPLVAGELLYSGCCSGHNAQVKKIPNVLPLGGVASAEGLSGGGTYPQYHFNPEGYRKLGERYAAVMYQFIKETKISSPRNRFVTEKSMQLLDKNAEVYSLNGKLVSPKLLNGGSLRNAGIVPGNIYVIKNGLKGNTTHLILSPSK